MNLFQAGCKLKVCRKGQEVTKVTVLAVEGDDCLVVEDNFRPDRLVYLSYLESVGCWVVNPSEDMLGGVFKPNLHYRLGCCVR